MGIVNFCRKVFVTGEVDLFSEGVSVISKTTKPSMIRFSDIAKKKLEEIQTELYVAGVRSTPPKITLKMISEASTTELNTHDVNKKEADLSSQEEFSSYQQTKTKRRGNAEPHRKSHPSKPKAMFQIP